MQVTTSRRTVIQLDGDETKILKYILSYNMTIPQAIKGGYSVDKLHDFMQDLHDRLNTS